jgi:alginate O-acetyltransferase complex protein AlgI
MVFASPIFLALFLPATLALYFLAPRAWRNGALMAASLAFYAWGEAAYVPLVLGSVLANWALGLAIERAPDGRARKARLAVAVAANLSVLAAFKYANFAVDNANAALAALGLATIALAPVPLPLGISFFTFHAISYVVDVYKRNASACRRLPDFALYILAFPQLIAGPIIRWRDIAAQLASRDERLADFAYGARRFAFGLGKKVLIANPLGEVADRVFVLGGGELTTPLAWLGLVCYTLQIYFDFSGYSDMAIGLMRMFGFRILENFNYPYVSRSVREFWRRWHISLSNWFRDYLYVPLGGNRNGALRAYRNLAIVFLLCGLWHGASWPFVLWGAWHGAFLIAERAGLDRALDRIGPFAHAYALLAAMGGWVLFRCETLGKAGTFYAALAGHGAASTPLPPAAILDPFVLTVLAAAIVGAVPVARVARAVRDALAARGGAVRTLALGTDLAWLAAVFVLAAAFLAAGTYNPFIYFRF